MTEKLDSNYFLHEPITVPDFDILKAQIDAKFGAVNDRIKGYADVIGKYFNVTPNLFYTKTRKGEIVKCRQLHLFFLHMVEGIRLNKLELMTDVDHSSILNAVDVVLNFYDVDQEYRDFINMTIGVNAMMRIRKNHITRKR